MVSNPCVNCGRRWIDVDKRTNCHMECEEYKEYLAKYYKKQEFIKKIKTHPADMYLWTLGKE